MSKNLVQYFNPDKGKKIAKKRKKQNKGDIHTKNMAICGVLMKTAYFLQSPACS